MTTLISSPARSRTLLPLAAALALSLSACGGGSGTTASAGASTQTASLVSLNGTAIDAPIAGAQITITSGAPLNDTGAQTIGTVTADGNGKFTLNVTLPSGSVPIFANAADPGNTAVILSSYLGQSDALAKAGALTTSNLPDLDISPVTTAALAVYAALNGNSYANLTAAAYAANLQTYRSDILAIAAAIKVVGDNLCTPATAPSSTTNLATTIAAGSNLSSGNSTTLSTAATTLGGNCPAVMASLPQQIAADPHFGPELELGDVIDAGVQSVPAGSYQLQGVIAETGLTSSSLTSAATVNPAAVFTDTAISIASNGQITSTDGKVSGTLVGNLVTLNVSNGVQTYALRGKVGATPAALVTGGQAYAIRSGGTNSTTNLLTGFEAILAPAAATPVWNGIAAPATTTQHDGVSCPANSFPVRLDAFGTDIGGGSVAECIQPSATGWNMSASATSGESFNFDDHAASSSVTPPSLTAPTWASATSAPFILTAAGASFSRNGVATSGTTYYVMGARSIVFASSTGNSLLSMHDTALSKIAESADNGGDSHLQDH